MISYTNDRSNHLRSRVQPSFLSPFGWYFAFALLVASTMGAALAFAT